MDLICIVPRPHLRAARWLRGIDFRPSWNILAASSLSKQDSLLKLGKLHLFVYLMISYFYDPSMFIYLWNSNFVCKVVLEREQGGRDAISCLLPILYCVWRVNLSKLSPNFIWTLTTTTTNCRISFIHLFPTNFRIAFLPHTNAVILLEMYCGTITEPG